MATCDSCGAAEETVFRVRRVYLTFDDAGAPASSTTLDEIEQWCFACCAQYPHDPV